MEGRQIEELIEELKVLKIREAAIIEQIKEAAKDERNPRTQQEQVNGIARGDRVQITTKCANQLCGLARLSGWRQRNGLPQ